MQMEWRRNGPLGVLRDMLPAGHLLPEDVWRRRHRVIVATLGAHAVALALYGWLAGYPIDHVLLETVVLGTAAAAAAGTSGRGHTLPACIATLGLMSASAILVHFSGGYIEAHFHFFVMLGVITLYQSWLPFLLAIAYVAVHHGVIGTLFPTAVYNHPAAAAQPWTWAGIHALFVVAASAVYLAAWRLTEHQALHDALTGLPNRLLFRDRLNHALTRAARSRHPLRLVIVDIDGFKAVNDTFGHATGDALLAAVAVRLRAVVRTTDTVARLGGDEFALILEGSTAPEAAQAVERVMSAFVQPFAPAGHEIAVRASAGVSLSDGSATDGDGLAQRADAAMYAAKALGKGQFVVFEPSMLRLPTPARRALEVQRAPDGSC